MSSEHIALVVRRTIRAPVERVFAAWTQAEQLRRWWGPKTVVCTEAEIDLRVGGAFRIANQFPDGKLLWISGEFLAIEAPVKLIYSWKVGDEPAPATERVTVNFERLGDATQVVVIHERIANPAARDEHEQGWLGCLDGLEVFFRE
jgi:uncharacterized protein YndB with AHSA1/START domain